MKKTLLIFTLITCLLKVKAQDLILTNTGDSINCKITKVEPENVYFTFNRDNQIRSTLINTTQLKEYKFNFYKSTLLPANKVFNNKEYSHWRYGFNIAYGYQTAKSGAYKNSIEKDYYNGLRSGFSFGADVTYFIQEAYGIGFKYNRFLTSNTLNNATLIPNNGGPSFIGNLSNDININFIAPCFSIRGIPKNEKNALIMNVALGYVGYRNNEISDKKYEATSSSFGAMLDFGYDVGLSKSTALNFQLSYLASTLSYMDVYDGTKTERRTFDKNSLIGLGRIDVCVGLKFRSGK
ncbi:MAG: hypothetical protein EAZ15_08080 [Sphingobacteriales bacterium]|nr:MAG: hypothetical protein EAZ15_08080 [Sphingobacteriales bacterium]